MMTRLETQIGRILASTEILLPPDRYVQVGDLRIRYWDEGRGEPVLLIHGFGASCEFWRLNLWPIAQQHRAIALDLPGHGLSDKRISDPSVEFAVDFLARFMDELGVDRTHIVGKSMGGGLALSIAVLHPERVNKLVLAGSVGLGREVAWRFRLFSLPVIREFLARPSRSGVRWLQRSLCSRPEVISEEWVDRVYRLARLPGASEALLAIASHWVDWRGQRLDRLRPIHQKLPQMRAPTLVLWGDRDPAVPLSHAFIAQRMIPGARLHIFANCGHMIQMEVPEEFVRVLLEFLADVEPDSVPQSGAERPTT